MENYLVETKMLDFSNPNIKALVSDRQWIQMDAVERVKNIYNYVRDDIKMGFSSSDDMKASQVLREGYGQCNTKSTLLMALLRAVHIPNRIHGFTVDKRLFKGILNGLWYVLAPKNILHGWVEVFVDNHWYVLEGVILDKPYLTALQRENSECKTSFCGFGAFTDDFQDPQVDWDRNNTYIQKKGINQDFGLFDTPDEFYGKHRQKLNPIKKWIFQNIVRHKMNKNIHEIRN